MDKVTHTWTHTIPQLKWRFHLPSAKEKGSYLTSFWGLLFLSVWGKICLILNHDIWNKICILKEYRFPHYVKVEHSCENFHKPKWHKAKRSSCFLKVHIILLHFYCKRKTYSSTVMAFLIKVKILGFLLVSKDRYVFRKTTEVYANF